MKKILVFGVMALMLSMVAIGAQSLDITKKNPFKKGQPTAIGFGIGAVEGEVRMVPDTSSLKYTRYYDKGTLYSVTSHGTSVYYYDYTRSEPQEMSVYYPPEKLPYTESGRVEFDRIQIEARGSDDYELVFPNGYRDAVSIPLAHAEGDQVKLGDEDDDLVINEFGEISKDDYFLIADYTQRPGQRDSFGLRYKGADKAGGDTQVLKFNLLGEDETEHIELPYVTTGELMYIEGVGLVREIAVLVIDSTNFKVYAKDWHWEVDDFSVWIDLNANKELANESVSINTPNGAEISIVELSAGIGVVVDTPTS